MNMGNLDGDEFQVTCQLKGRHMTVLPPVNALDHGCLTTPQQHHSQVDNRY